MTRDKKPVAWWEKIIFKRVSFLWLVAAVFFWVLAAVAVVCIMILGAGFNSYQDYLQEGRYNCAEYCEARGQTLFLHDYDTQACQCYNDAEEPTDYKNLRSGVEIEHRTRNIQPGPRDYIGG